MNTKSTKKVRFIIRQWTPRKMPYSITHDRIHEFIKEHYSTFNTVVYAGWSRRHDPQGHRKIGFYVSTGSTSNEARKRFKESSDFGKQIWELKN